MSEWFNTGREDAQEGYELYDYKSTKIIFGSPDGAFTRTDYSEYRRGFYDWVENN